LHCTDLDQREKPGPSALVRCDGRTAFGLALYEASEWHAASDERQMDEPRYTPTQWRHRLAKQRRSRNLDSTATAVGDSLGRVAARVDALKKQRQEVAEELRALISTAQGMLAELGDDAVVLRRRAEKVVRPTAKKGKRQLSPEGRARLVAALKKRWAKVRKEKAAKT